MAKKCDSIDVMIDIHDATAGTSNGKGHPIWRGERITQAESVELASLDEWRA
jgi:hypothetical protein